MKGEGNPGGGPREDTAHFRIYHTFSWQSVVIIISKEDDSLGDFFVVAVLSFETYSFVFSFCLPFSVSMKWSESVT